MKPRVLFLVGPTACGKSQIALELAKQLNGEIISADSMLVYKGMDIGTAKPSRAEQKQVPHHLIDLFAPSRNFSVFEYRKRAVQKIADITKRGKLPLVVGGTGLYVRALLQGLENQPAANPALRKKLEKESKEKGLLSLYKKLVKKDPKRAEKIKPGDKRRIIRALEVVLQSGKKTLGREKGLEELGYEPVVIGITKDRQELYAAIEARVDQMFHKGLAREVKRVAKGRLSRTARQAVGYKELLGKEPLEKAKDLIKLNSRHLAKRQWTWFKREKGLIWVTWEKEESAGSFLEKIKSVLPPSFH